MAEDYIQFDEALKRLELQDAQLKRLISENEIKAYRDGDRMKLKRDDVDRLRARLSGGGGQTEELVFEDDEAEGEPGMATVPLSEAETMMERSAPKKVNKPAPAAKSAGKPAPAKNTEKAAAPRRAKKEVTADVAGEGTAMKALLFLTVLLMVTGVFVAFDNVKGFAGSVSANMPGMSALKK